MILYDLRCRRGHVFEAWFRDSAAYDDQVPRPQATERPYFEVLLVSADADNTQLADRTATSATWFPPPI